ncbi:hypothetical protein F4778DRAFT_488700 [Xylariomycetidae sp. FL2044]|nr:hypothetical protein F4778DRAFT_488700 [Xylariomycetidae sp. FL2044]
MSTVTGSPLRTLLLTEGVLKFVGGLMFIVSPQTPLSVAIKNPIPPSSLLLVRLLGTQTFTLGIPMLLASRRTQAAVASRRIVYWTVFARDATLLAMLAVQYWLGDKDQPLGFTRAGLQAWMMEILPFAFGHLWILTQKPQWFS